MPNNITVLVKGKPNEFKVVKPKGGQIPPISTEGDKAEWKKLQNTEKKANASEIINKINH